MTNHNLTEIAIILDRSGSMDSIREDMIGGFATFVAEQAKLPGKCVVSLYQFDDRFECVYEERSVRHTRQLELVPRGSTALLDACGRAVTMIGERLAGKAEEHRPSKVVVLIITDGRENASREYSRAQVQELIRRQHDVYGWQFAYLGANVDAFTEARGLGVEAGANYQPTRGGVRGMYGAVGAAVANYRSSGESLTSASLQGAEPDKVEP